MQTSSRIGTATVRRTDIDQPATLGELAYPDGASQELYHEVMCEQAMRQAFLDDLKELHPHLDVFKPALRPGFAVIGHSQPTTARLTH